MTGLVEEYDAEGEWPDTLTEIDSSALGEVTATGETHEGFDPIALDGVTDLEPYEGLLVTVTELVVEDGQLPYGEWAASGWTFDDKLLEQDTVYPGDTFERVTGVLDYSYGSFKIQPRTGEDLVGHVSTVVGVDQLSEGQLTVTELMIDPGSDCVDADDEYVELYNASGYQVDLDGLVVHYDDGSSTLGYAVVAPYSYVLLVRQSPSPCYGHAGDAELHLPLTQQLGEVALRYKLRGATVSVSVNQQDPGDALREALRMLAAGEAPYVVTGCADAAREPAAGFDAAMRAVVAVLARTGEGIAEVSWPESSAENPFAALARRCGLASAAADADQRGE